MKEDRTGGRKGKGDRTLGERFRRNHGKNRNTNNFPKENDFISKQLSFVCYKVPFYRNERREVSLRSCFAAVDLVDSVWHLLTFTRREDETKKSPDDVPSSGLLCSCGDVERFRVRRMMSLRECILSSSRFTSRGSHGTTLISWRWIFPGRRKFPSQE